MQHFFINQDLSGSHVVISDEELIHQMKDVLRFRIGNECILLDNNGTKSKGVVENIDKKAVIIRLSDNQTCERPKKEVRLFIALSKKPATFELIVQKATELGISEIIPLVTERCQVNELRNEKRLKLIIKEAAEQCERCFLPELKAVLKWSEFVKNLPSGLILTGDARKSDGTLNDFKIENDVNLVIGPEGGLTDDELEDVRKNGGKIFLLGENVLRMETAAIAALSILLC